MLRTRRAVVWGIFILLSSVDAFADAVPATQPADPAAVTTEAMDVRLDTFAIQNEGLEIALQRLAAAGKITLDIRWDDLAAGGIMKDSPTFVKTKEVKVGKILEIMLRDVAQTAKIDQPEKMPATQILDNGQVLITTRGVMFTKFALSRKYDISDLMVDIGNDEAVRKQLVASIAKLIQDTVAPDSWDASTGNSIKVDGATLEIVQTDENHRLIGALIAQLRSQRGINADAGADSRKLPPSDPPKSKVLMDANVRELILSGTELSEVFGMMRKATGQNIFVNWRAMEAAGVVKSLPVTTDLSDLPLDQALGQLLAEVGADQVRLGYEVDEEVITVSTVDDLSSNVLTRVYDIRRAIGNEATREVDIARIISRVRGIYPMSWREAGGKVGAIRELEGQLIVTHTPEIQARIVEELRDMLPADQEEWPLNTGRPSGH